MSIATLSLVLLTGALTVTAAFNPYEHLGNLSPYFDAPNLSGLSTDLPASCSVQQVSLVRSHLIHLLQSIALERVN